MNFFGNRAFHLSDFGNKIFYLVVNIVYIIDFFFNIIIGSFEICGIEHLELFAVKRLNTADEFFRIALK